jgi:hypothetical protein
VESRGFNIDRFGRAINVEGVINPEEPVTFTSSEEVFLSALKADPAYLSYQKDCPNSDFQYVTEEVVAALLGKSLEYYALVRTLQGSARILLGKFFVPKHQDANSFFIDDIIAGDKQIAKILFRSVSLRLVE